MQKCLPHQKKAVTKEGSHKSRGGNKNRIAMLNFLGNTPSSLVGMWYNQLGSAMQIYDVTDEGILEGRYSSNVGNASRWYTLRG